MAQIDTLTNVGAVVSTDLALVLRGGANVLGTLGSMVGQNSTAVTITGGTINGTTIGATTPASIAGTTLTTTGAATFSSTLSATQLTSTSSSASLPGFAVSAGNGMYNPATNSIGWSTASTNRMTLDASGNLLVGTTTVISGAHVLAKATSGTYNTVFASSSATVPYGIDIRFTGTAPNNATESFMVCEDTVNAKFIIYSNGNASNQTGAAIGTISDVRLKENIVPATPKLADILAVDIVNYNRIGSEQKLLGVKAHQLQEIFPSLVDTHDTRKYDDDGELVSGFEDELHVKVGFDFATYTKCFQEQQAIIEAQASAIDTLTARLDAAGL